MSKKSKCFYIGLVLWSQFSLNSAHRIKIYLYEVLVEFRITLSVENLPVDAVNQGSRSLSIK